MSLCILNQAGAIVRHRHMPAGPEPFLKAMAPSRDDLVVCVACRFTWDWLADLCAREGLPCVLGHARYLQAIHGGKAKHETIEAQKMAVLRRGGMRPQAYVYPAAMRATRDRLRRRMHVRRQRAEWLGHLQQTTRPYHLPDLGQKIASKANRDGVAERCAEPAVHQSLDVDLALMGHDDERRRDLERSILNAATPHDAHTRDRLRTVPGLGAIRRLVLLYASHDLQRFPRGQAVVASGRLVTWAQASAGQRYGTAGTTIGHAYLQWAFSAAAVFFLRHHPPGQQWLVRLEKQPGQGTALTVRAHTRARAVYHL
jgi:transposase